MGKFSWLHWFVSQATIVIVFLIIGIKEPLDGSPQLVLAVLGLPIVWGFISPKIFKEMDEL